MNYFTTEWNKLLQAWETDDFKYCRDVVSYEAPY